MAVPLLDPRAGSPGESQARVILVRAGLGPLRAAVVIFDEHGGWIAEVDLVLDDPPVIFQYDGAVHFRTDAQRRSDAVRDELPRDLGWEVVTVTNRDLQDPDRLVRRAIAAARRAAGRRRPLGSTAQPALPLPIEPWLSRIAS